MKFKALPVKYYLTHFFELLDTLDCFYQPVIEKKHLAFIDDFRALSEDAQCIYVRMVNRKGQIFSRNSFKRYQEIKFPRQAVQELEQQKFVNVLGEDDKKGAIEFLTKPQLIKWMKVCGIEFKPSWSKEELSQTALENLTLLKMELLTDLNELVVQGRYSELEYLLFLYFGKIQTGLNLYTLRDLGIRKTNETKKFLRPRYVVADEAKTEYFFSKTMETVDQLNTLTEIKAAVEECNKLKGLRTSAKILKNDLFLQLAEKAADLDIEFSLSILADCYFHPAREKRCRMLFKLSRKEECRQLLEEICKDPSSDEELLFAEDFLSRKFEKKKIGYLTEALNNSKEIALSDAYFKRPERGVRDLYRSQGIQAHFTENYLWTGLFGLFFWEELFEKDTSALYNPFDRTPADLVGSEFYDNNKKSIEKKLELLVDVADAEFHLLKMLSSHHGKLNDIFRWHPNLIRISIDFLKSSSGKNVAHILRTMAQKFELYHKGFPDLMIIKNGEASFIEVKAEGDTLRSQQLSKVRLLSEAGFNVEILKVKWETDPNQIYVVVDVETTGGSSHFHRVTEIGAVKVRGGEVLEEFQTLINPGRPIPKNITQITGITNEMVADAPKFSDIAEQFEAFTKGAIFVAHNSRFDYGFIQREFQRVNVDFVRPQMCTVQGMRKNFPGLKSYSLKNLTQHFRISLDQHHRALCDAKATVELLHLINGKRAPNPKHYFIDEYSTDFPREVEFHVG